MHACLRVVYLGIVVYSNALLNVSLFLSSIDSRRYLPYTQEGHWPKPQKGYGRPGPWGEGCGHPSFQDTNSSQRDAASRREHEGRVPSQNAVCAGRIVVRLHTQIKNSHKDDKVVLAYEILCISANRCTDRRNRIEKTGVPDTLALLNVEDAWHLERLAWVVYDSAILVGLRPKLLGIHAWCAVLAGLQRHIYRGHNDVAHCPPQMLGSWDHEEWVEALRHMGGLSGQRRISWPQRRSRSSLRWHSQMLACEGQPQATSPHMPSRCPLCDREVLLQCYRAPWHPHHT